MRLPASMAAFVMGVLIVTAAPAAAVTIPVSINSSSSVLFIDLYNEFATFTLPAGFSNASLNITAFAIDDRGTLRLNGVIVASTGINGPGPGFMRENLSNDPFTFQYGNSGPFASITTGFFEGLNILHVTANDTGAGILGDLNPNSQPTSVLLTANVTYDVAVSEIPLPAALPLFASGLGMLGLLAWRRKKKAAA